MTALLSTPSPSPLASAHVASANRALSQALHYHRHFGKPIAGFSDAHNAMRARANDAHVAALAFEAGRYACFSGRPAEEWTSSQAAAVIAIWNDFERGYQDTARLLAGEVSL